MTLIDGKILLFSFFFFYRKPLLWDCPYNSNMITCSLYILLLRVDWLGYLDLKKIIITFKSKSDLKFAAFMQTCFPFKLSISIPRGKCLDVNQKRQTQKATWTWLLTHPSLNTRPVRLIALSTPEDFSQIFDHFINRAKDYTGMPGGLLGCPLCCFPHQLLLSALKQ